MYKLCNDNKNRHDYLNKKHRNKNVKNMVAWITFTFLGAKNFQFVLQESSTAKFISEINKATALDNLLILIFFWREYPSFGDSYTRRFFQYIGWLDLPIKTKKENKTSAFIMKTDSNNSNKLAIHFIIPWNITNKIILNKIWFCKLISWNIRKTFRT